LSEAGPERTVAQRAAIRRVTVTGWPLARLALFSGLTMLLAIDQRRRLGSMVPGDPGDAFLILSLLEWGGDRSVHLFDGYWNGPMFAGGNDVMAYTDSFLPLAVPFKLIELVTGSRVIAFNALYLSSWVLCAESTYHLARRLMASRGAATVAAVGFTFSTIRLAQTNHFQLAWAGLIPLSLLLLVRLLDRSTWQRGVGLALVILALTLTSAYYGLIMLLFTSAVVILQAAIDAWRRVLTERWRGVAAFLLTVGIPMLYVRHKYEAAQASSTSRTVYPGVFALRLGDLRSPAPRSSYMRRIGVLDTDVVVRSSENYAYIGVLVIVLVPLLAVLIVVRPQQAGVVFAARRIWLMVAGLGVGAALIAVGRGPILGLHMPFYDWARDVVPGVSSIVALVRLFVFGQLLLSLLAAAATGWVLARLPSPQWRYTVCCVLIAVLVIEAQTAHSMVRVVNPRPGSVFEVLDELEPGVVAIIPLPPPPSGGLYAYVEATRMVLGSDDDMRTVNGYSGYAPAAYEQHVESINGFPSPTALDTLRALDVRYVVLPTAPIDTGADSISRTVNDSGFAFIEADEAERRIDQIPDAWLGARYDAVDGIIVELMP
jgi:hypothetical protein